MAEYIEREKVEEFIEKGLNNPDKLKAYGFDAVAILSKVHFMPAADVAEVVRCKDCKSFGKFGSAFVCSELGDRVSENDFCSRGKRMDGEGE